MTSQANKVWWDSVVEKHRESPYYDIEGFINNPSKITLGDLEIREIGDVNGLDLLHLQCHIGLDTLSWQRLGANTTGIDFSFRAIQVAEECNSKSGLEASFYCSDVYDVPSIINRKFDIVFSSYGVLSWLRDLDAYAQVLHTMLVEGGRYYLAEIHPFIKLLESSDTIPYESGHQVTEVVGSYVDTDQSLESTQVYYIHKISDIVNALIKAGFRVEFLHEFNCSTYRFHHSLKEYEYGLGLSTKPNIPLVYSIMVTKL